MNLSLVGVSHHQAPIELRERVAVDLDGAAALARALADGCEAVVLSTCNRTEIYLAAERRTGAGATRGHCAARSGRGRGGRARARASTASRTSRPRCTCSGSPPGSTRSCRAKGEILGPGARRVRSRRPGPAARPALPQRAPRRPPRTCRDCDRREPRVCPRRRGRARAAGVRRPRRARRWCSSAPAR